MTGEVRLATARFASRESRRGPAIRLRAHRALVWHGGEHRAELFVCRALVAHLDEAFDLAAMYTQAVKLALGIWPQAHFDDQARAFAQWAGVM
jgi:hypothetical protein